MSKQTCPVPDHGLLTACVWDGVPDGYVDLTFRVRDTGHFLDGGTTARVEIEGAGMSNVDEAAWIVDETMSRWDMEGRPAIPGGIGLHLTHVLANAGLLMPDLPEPVEKFTSSDASWMLTGKAAVDSWRDEGGPVVALMAGRGRHLTPAEARQLAYILLAAANHAEEEE